MGAVGDLGGARAVGGDGGDDLSCVRDDGAVVGSRGHGASGESENSGGKLHLVGFLVGLLDCWYWAKYFPFARIVA